jgi:hypothetical protein
MLNKIAQHKWNILALLAIWLFFECWISWAAFCEYANQRGAPYQSTDEYGCIFRGPVVSLGRSFYRWWRYTFDKPDAYIALFTLILALSTITLWLATKRTANIAERALTELERPFLGVEVLQSGLSFTETGTVTSPISDFKYQFVNYGRTPARLTELVETWPVIKRINEKEGGSRYSYTSVLPNPIDPTRQSGRKLPFGVVVSSGKPFLLTANAFAVIDIQNLAVRPWFHGTGSDLYFCGYVRYTDIFNKRYIFGFCAIFDYNSRHFVLMGDDRYNYNREES